MQERVAAFLSRLTICPGTRSLLPLPCCNRHGREKIISCTDDLPPGCRGQKKLVRQAALRVYQHFIERPSTMRAGENVEKNPDCSVLLPCVDRHAGTCSIHREGISSWSSASSCLRCLCKPRHMRLSATRTSCRRRAFPACSRHAFPNPMGSLCLTRYWR